MLLPLQAYEHLQYDECCSYLGLGRFAALGKGLSMESETVSHIQRWWGNTYHKLT